MSSETTEQPEDTIQDLADEGRCKLEDTCAGAKDALSAIGRHIRENPWIVVAGAAVLGGAIVALSRTGKPEPTKWEAVRDWLDETYAKLPSQKQVQSMADSSGVPGFFQQLRKRLHLD